MHIVTNYCWAYAQNTCLMSTRRVLLSCQCSGRSLAEMRSQISPTCTINQYREAESVELIKTHKLKHAQL